jgi:hypothetical protein
MPVTYRHKTWSDRGVLVEATPETPAHILSDGRQFFKLQDWICDDDARHYTRQQLARIALTADLHLVALLNYSNPKKVADLHENELKSFFEVGPRAAKDKAHLETRQNMYDAIMSVLTRAYGETKT